MNPAALLLLVLVFSGPQDSGADEVRRIPILFRGRVKPLDSMARESMRLLTGKERFSGYTDPETRREIAVFPDRDPVLSLLRLIAQPERYRALRFIRLDHPDLKKRLELPEDQVYFSLDELSARRGRMLMEREQIEDEQEATSSQRALLEILNKQRFVDLLMTEELLAIIPIPFGSSGSWMTPADLRTWLAGSRPTDGRFRELGDALARWLEGGAGREALLQRIVAAYDRMLGSIASDRGEEFRAAAADLRRELGQVNPDVWMTAEEVAREIHYNEARPFTWAWAIFGLAAVLFIGAYVFDSRGVWIAAMAADLAGIGMTAYGYMLRWQIADRYPLANHYESMIAVGFGAAILSFLAELILRRRVFGLAGAVVSLVMILLANTVPAFANQSPISTIAPALATFWMTIHVPVILLGYAGGAIICVLGHIYLFTYLFRKSSPEKEASLAVLDDVMKRALQVTVLFLLAGILLGAVWAWDAWGRPWGWDMKETWALITLIAYLLTMHGRFTGYVRGLGTALAALGSFALLVLTYYGVNFLFGRGLHTYGFGSAEVWPVAVFFAAEALLAGAAVVRWLARRDSPPPREPLPL